MGKRLYRAEVLYDPASSTRIKRDHGVQIDENGRIARLAPWEEFNESPDDTLALITPGFANAHIHLTDAARQETVPGGEGLVPWVRSLLRSRSAEGLTDDAESARAEALRTMRRTGTEVIGEVVNDEGTIGAIRRSGMKTRFIWEMIGARASAAGEIIDRFRTTAHGLDRENVRVSPGIHAPYSVSLELIDLIIAESTRRGLPTYIHLAEDPAERELYRSGEGVWREFLEEIGVWRGDFQPPREDPIDYFDRQGYLTPLFTAVHLTDASDSEIALLAARGASAILSPTSNLHITGNLPPYPTILRTGLRFGLGTDGRGSNPSIDVLDEARLLVRSFPDEPIASLLRALIPDGCAILGFPEACRIVAGEPVGLLAHSVPVDDLTEEGIARAVLSEENRIERIS